MSGELNGVDAAVQRAKAEMAADVEAAAVLDRLEALYGTVGGPRCPVCGQEWVPASLGELIECTCRRRWRVEPVAVDAPMDDLSIAAQALPLIGEIKSAFHTLESMHQRLRAAASNVLAAAPCSTDAELSQDEREALADALDELRRTLW